MTRKKRRSSVRKTTKRRRRRSSSYMGGIGGRGTVGKIQSMLTSTAIGTAAAIGGSMLLAKAPVANPKIKAALPLAAGIFLSLMAKGKSAKLMYQASTGLMIAGGLGLTKQIAPQFALAGEDELYNSAYLQDNSGMGMNTDYMGLNSQVIEDEFSNGF